MSRVQIALNVSNIEAAVTFYRKLLGTEPAKSRPGYANFTVVEPPLKLVLIENVEKAGTLNHLGVEVETPAQVAEAGNRLKQAGLKTEAEEQVNCCYAVQDKVWVKDPDGSPWEVYTVLSDSTTPPGVPMCQSAPCCA